jgi:hypothetical protein
MRMRSAIRIQIFILMSSLLSIITNPPYAVSPKQISIHGELITVVSMEQKKCQQPESSASLLCRAAIGIIIFSL